MKNIELKIFILVLSIFVLLSNLNSSYAKYVSSSSGEVGADMTKWRILLNNTDITTNNTINLSFTPVVNTCTNVNTGKLAPGCKGYFDVFIDCSNIKTSFNYEVTVEKTGEIDNLKVLGYRRSTATITNTTAPDVSFASSGLYPDSKTFNINKNLPVSGTHTNIYLRFYFQWIDNYNSTSTNTSDTLIGEKVANNQGVNYNINVSFTFRQI